MYSFGDRVRVSDDWFMDEIRGWIGTVARPPTGTSDDRLNGIYWVEFDSLPTDTQPHPTTGAAIDADYLTLAKDT
jgi:hypothetical protein